MSHCPLHPDAPASPPAALLVARVPGGRAGLALPLVLAFLAIAALLLFAAGRLRRDASLRADVLLARLRLQAAGEAALSEVSGSRALTAALEDPTRQQALKTALASGVLTGGVLTPGDHALLVEPELVRGGLPSSTRVGPVEVRVLEYLPGSNRALIRFLVDVEVTSAGGGIHGTVAQDHEAALTFGGADRVGLLLAPDPIGRLLP